MLKISRGGLHLAASCFWRLFNFLHDCFPALAFGIVGCTNKWFLLFQLSSYTISFVLLFLYSCLFSLLA
ncbi:hypothetical protein BDZ91DRAFT_10718 [Kalaharituber pfeilii]|nr:hypothetical protein BDZ91DRAFT_10718 [Kalaharituber pfeilii]